MALFSALGKALPAPEYWLSVEVRAMNDEDLELDDLGEDGEPEREEVIKLSPATDLEARRRLEARLEERRLMKLIQDYDFDIYETA